jgi:hypothetical protein
MLSILTVFTASMERYFLTLKYLKTYLKNIMSRANNLFGLVNIYKYVIEELI